MLTVKQIDSAKPQEKSYRLADSGGLFLFVPPSGKKVWRMRYRFDGREKTLVIGPHPEITLTEARARQAEARVKLANGIDPGEQKQAAKRKVKEAEADSFEVIFREWHRHKSAVWAERYADEMKRMFESDILPSIGHLKLDDIEPMVLLKMLRIFEERGSMSQADKARRRCGEVFKYAVVTGRARYNPAPDLSGALTGYQKNHYPFLPMHRIHEFNRALLGYGGSIITKLATRILQYTALRTIELRTLQWENVDFENGLINVSEVIMKKRRKHVVPMSDQVHALLSELKLITGQYPYVFSGRNDPKSYISENTILGVIRRIGYEGQVSGHGFRHHFSTVLNEKGWNKDAIEAQLAHITKEGTRQVYNHAKYMTTRIEMMQYWADWIDEKAD